MSISEEKMQEILAKPLKQLATPKKERDQTITLLEKIAGARALLKLYEKQEGSNSPTLKDADSLLRDSQNILHNLNQKRKRTR